MEDVLLKELGLEGKPERISKKRASQDTDAAGPSSAKQSMLDLLIPRSSAAQSSGSSSRNEQFSGSLLQQRNQMLTKLLSTPTTSATSSLSFDPSLISELPPNRRILSVNEKSDSSQERNSQSVSNTGLLNRILTSSPAERATIARAQGHINPVSTSFFIVLVYFFLISQKIKNNRIFSFFYHTWKWG